MIPTLYDCFKHWAKSGSVYIISDTHFEDADCKLMDKDWILPQEHVKAIKERVHKTDTLIHLGDVGNIEYFSQIPGYKVLIMGNHDQGVKKYKEVFDEVYQGPLFIADKLLLSHEPILSEYWFNVHGHDHSNENKEEINHINLASNVYGYKVFNLGKEIEKGLLKDVENIHRHTIDKATERKQKRGKDFFVSFLER